ncbi:MAG: hypothetical protein GEV10_17285 [Streptosporangiales bacterium]|nr:hypothetical protein [Streptosporangiales bacterium]
MTSDWYFEDKLGFAISHALPEVLDDATQAVEDGIRRIQSSVRIGFNLGGQLADIADVIIEADVVRACRLGYEILDVDSSPATLLVLAALVFRGKLPVSLELGARLQTVGNDRIRRRVDEAFRQREER